MKSHVGPIKWNLEIFNSNQDSKDFKNNKLGIN